MISSQHCLLAPAQTQRPTDITEVQTLPIFRSPVKKWCQKTMTLPHKLLLSLASMHLLGSWRFAKPFTCIDDLIVIDCSGTFALPCFTEISIKCIFCSQVGCGVGNSVFPIINTIKWVNVVIFPYIPFQLYVCMSLMWLLCWFLVLPVLTEAKQFKNTKYYPIRYSIIDHCIVESAPPLHCLATYPQSAQNCGPWWHFWSSVDRSKIYTVAWNVQT